MSYVPEWMRGRPENSAPPEAVQKAATHASRQVLAAALAKRFESLPERINAWKRLPVAEYNSDDPTVNNIARESRPELDAMGKFGRRSEQADELRKRAAQQAECLIREASRPINFEDFRADGTRMSPGPGISSAKPVVIRW